ncbi:hypothetical protein POVWA2_010170 [Plasmodium ovale wallikeri]|uniref:Uncharacterized protein n=1 Tax=Plasmodium ovale wallikeri TaxID=864142 RepID=A0A1A8YM06_PLAOA|nr:hypothetical protein POVWA1_009980 [Plasmodium ovale wallikeri]SBT32543.1 hypothetical protein POVWA2_010170 [Plasmodium ovale wallikeri]
MSILRFFQCCDFPLSFFPPVVKFSRFPQNDAFPVILFLRKLCTSESKQGVIEFLHVPLCIFLPAKSFLNLESE